MVGGEGEEEKKKKHFVHEHYNLVIEIRGQKGEEGREEGGEKEDISPTLQLGEWFMHHSGPLDLIQ